LLVYLMSLELGSPLGFVIVRQLNNEHNCTKETVKLVQH